MAANSRWDLIQGLKGEMYTLFLLTFLIEDFFCNVVNSEELIGATDYLTL
jgi:hypothetical protein